MTYYQQLLSFIENNISDWQQKLNDFPYYVSAVQCKLTDMNGNIKFPNLYMLSYSQFNSDFNNPIVKACRGCIVEVIDDKAKMICTPFYKFGNYGESYCDNIDWNTAKVLDKVDGSLLKLFNYNDEWIWVTNNGWNITSPLQERLVSPFKEDETSSAESFNDLKEYALSTLFSEKELNEWYNSLDKENTYMFELISPNNRVICTYPHTELYFLGVRNRNTYLEKSYDEFCTYPNFKKFKKVKQFDLHDIESVLALCNSYDTTEKEGVVICDANFNRIKIKCAHYLKLKYIKNECIYNKNKLYVYLQDGNLDDIYNIFPEQLTVFNEMVETKNKALENLNKIYNFTKNEYCKYNSRKDFAIKITSEYNKFAYLFFTALQSKEKLYDTFNKLSYDKVKELSEYVF